MRPSATQDTQFWRSWEFVQLLILHSHGPWSTVDAPLKDEHSNQSAVVSHALCSWNDYHSPCNLSTSHTHSQIYRIVAIRAHGSPLGPREQTSLTTAEQYLLWRRENSCFFQKYLRLSHSPSLGYTLSQKILAFWLKARQSRPKLPWELLPFHLPPPPWGTQGSASHGICFLYLGRIYLFSN